MVQHGWLILAPVTGICLAAACSEGDARAEQGPPDQTPHVQVERSRPGSLSSSWTFLGQTRPALEASLAAAVEGHVRKVTVREGDAVDRGDTLVVLDGDKARAALAATQARVQGTEARLAQAERQFARVEGLQQPTISEPEREQFGLSVESLRAELRTRRAEVRRLRVEVAHHVIRAPFAGVIKARLVDPGDWVSTGQSTLELVSLEELEIHVDVSQEIGRQLSLDERARLAGPTDATARIRGIVPALDPSTRTMRVRLVPEQRPPWLVPGMAVEVTFDVELDGDGVIVPRDALVRGPVDTRVVIVANGKSRTIDVEVLAASGQQILVHGEGLAPGQAVVVRGNERLTSGQTVEIVE